MRKVRQISAHVGVLERRADFLETRATTGERRESSRVFDRKEVKALRFAVGAMRLYQVLQQETSSPIYALDELVEALEEAQDHGHQLTPRTLEALGAAKAVLTICEAQLEEFGGDD